MPSIYKPLSAFVPPASLAGAPAALHQALEQTEVFCSSQASSSFQAKISWIDGWWFSLAGGNGRIVIRDAAGTRNADYFILFLPLSGQNWRSGSASSKRQCRRRSTKTQMSRTSRRAGNAKRTRRRACRSITGRN